MAEENQNQDALGLPYGRYLIRKRVARGGMGEVFLADQLGPTGQPIRPVALKRMLPRIARKPHAAKMFLEEMATAAQLNHPNIATTYDFGEVDGTYFFAMEYLQGLSLSQLLKALGALPVAHTVHICLKVLEALDHAHQRKTISGKIAPVVHRDVSPHNVMISTDGAVKLLDFGISRAETEVMGGRLEGKIAYAAPEQLQGGLVDRRSDLWAVGVMMYELLCGFRPYEMASIDEIIIVARQENFLPIEKSRPEAQVLSEIINQSLRFEKAHRWNDAESTINAIRNLTSSFPAVGPQQLAELVAAAGGPTTSVLGVEHITSFGQSADEPNGTATATIARPPADPKGLTPLRTRDDVQVNGLGELAVSETSPKAKGFRATIIFSVMVLFGGFAVFAHRFTQEPKTKPITTNIPALKAPILRTDPKEQSKEAVALTTESKSKPKPSVSKVQAQNENLAGAAGEVPRKKARKESVRRKNKTQKRTIKPRPKAKDNVKVATTMAESKQTQPRPTESTPTQAVPKESTNKVVGPGHVSVTSTPWANIEIDGKAYGVTPKLKIKLKPGQHRLRLTPGDGNQQSEKVFPLKISSGQHIRIIANFSEKVFKILGQ